MLPAPTRFLVVRLIPVFFLQVRRRRLRDSSTVGLWTGGGRTRSRDPRGGVPRGHGQVSAGAGEEAGHGQEDCGQALKRRSRGTLSHNWAPMNSEGHGGQRADASLEVTIVIRLLPRAAAGGSSSSPTEPFL